MKVFDFLSIGFLLGLSINLVGIFFFASFNGGQAQVTVNTFGEQGVEAVLFPIFIIMGIITLLRAGRGLAKPPNKRKNDD